MIKMQLVNASEMPNPLLDAYAVHRPGEVVYVVREDIGPERMAAAVNRIGSYVTREAVDAAHQRGEPARE